MEHNLGHRRQGHFARVECGRRHSPRKRSRANSGSSVITLLTPSAAIAAQIPRLIDRPDVESSPSSCARARRRVTVKKWGLTALNPCSRAICNASTSDLLPDQPRHVEIGRDRTHSITGRQIEARNTKPSRCALGAQVLDHLAFDSSRVVVGGLSSDSRFLISTLTLSPPSTTNASSRVRHVGRVSRGVR